MTVSTRSLTVHCDAGIIRQGRVVSKDEVNHALVYSTATATPSPSVAVPRHVPTRQLEHSVWTPDQLRNLSRSFIPRDDQVRLPVKRRLSGALLIRWTRGIAENEPHAVDPWYSIVSTWLRRGDHVKVAEDFFLGRRWAYELVSRYLGAASYYLFADDLRAAVCRQTHGSAGGRGSAFNRDGAGLFAETCHACVLLRGADWEGWVTIEGAGD